MRAQLIRDQVVSQVATPPPPPSLRRFDHVGCLGFFLSSLCISGFRPVSRCRPSYLSAQARSLGRRFFFIFFLSRFCENIWSVRNFAKLYIYRRGPRRKDIIPWPEAVGAASSGPVGLNATGHNVRSLKPWTTTLGAYRQAAA
jgi:hypothetical protein